MSMIIFLALIFLDYFNTIIILMKRLNEYFILIFKWRYKKKLKFEINS